MNKELSPKDRTDLTELEKKAIDFYVEKGDEINQFLRNINYCVYPTKKDVESFNININLIDSSIDKSKLIDDHVIFRGICCFNYDKYYKREIEFLESYGENNSDGNWVFYEAYLPFSMSLSEALSFTRHDEKNIKKIVVTKVFSGARSLFINDIIVAREYFDSPVPLKEKEILLPREVNFQILGSKTMTIDNWGVYFIYIVIKPDNLNYTSSFPQPTNSEIFTELERESKKQFFDFAKNGYSPTKWEEVY